MKSVSVVSWEKGRIVAVPEVEAFSEDKSFKKLQKGGVAVYLSRNISVVLSNFFE